MTRQRGKGRRGGGTGSGPGRGEEVEGPRFVLGSEEETSPAPTTLDERFKQLAEQRERAKVAGLALRRAEAADRATQDRYDKLTAKRKGTAVSLGQPSQAATAVGTGIIRGGATQVRGRGGSGKKLIPVRRQDGAAVVAAGFGLGLPRRPGIAARRGAKVAMRMGRGAGKVVKGAAAIGRGRGRGSGATRGRGRGGGRGGPTPSAEQLNSDLDAYFSEAKKD